MTDDSTPRLRAPEKRYLGDGVYIAPGSYLGEFILTTEDGISVQNSIVLDSAIVQGIARFVDHTIEYAASASGIAAEQAGTGTTPATLPPGQEPLSDTDKATLRRYLEDKGLTVPEDLK